MMNNIEFHSLKVGDKVKNGINARSRTIEYIYDDPNGARIVNCSRIQNCSKSFDNLQFGSDSYYTEWRLA